MSDEEKNEDRREPLTPRQIRAKERMAKLNCAYCPPHKGENAKRKPKHGAKKPKKR